MAKDSQPQRKDTPSKGKSKSERHSATTEQNKRRGAETRQNRRLAAVRRRASNDFIYPEGPYRGSKTRRGTKVHKESMERREIQAVRVATKQEGRRKFARLTPAEKAEHRAAGMEHRKPRDLAKAGR